MSATCPQCGLPYAECNALALARDEVEKHLRRYGYSGTDARRRAGELVPHPRMIVMIEGEGR